MDIRGTFRSTNNPETQGHATGYTVDLRTPAANKLVASTAAWFTVGADIIKDLKRMNALADDDSVGMPSNRVSCAPKHCMTKS
jgi:hypothetical protein